MHTHAHTPGKCLSTHLSTKIYVIWMRISHAFPSFSLLVSVAFARVMKIYREKIQIKGKETHVFIVCKFGYASIGFLRTNRGESGEAQNGYITVCKCGDEHISRIILIGHAWISKIALRMTITRWLIQYIILRLSLAHHAHNLTISRTAYSWHNK